MKKDKKVKVLPKNTSKKRPTTKKTKKGSKVSLLNRFQGLSRRTQIIIFGLIFALIGGGYFLYQSRASDGLPDGANQLVVSYEIGIPHLDSLDEFHTDKGNISMLLYGNGLMLCSVANMQQTNQELGSKPAWNSRQLSRDEVHALVDSMKQAGFDKAAANRELPNGFLPPSETGRYISINTVQGATQAVTYPGLPDTGFTAVENILKNECSKTTTAYEPDNVVAETITLPSDSPAISQATGNLPDGLEVDTTPKEHKSKELKGRDANSIKKQLSREPKIYKKGDQYVTARYVDRIPDWDALVPPKQSSKGKVYAASALKTRWLVVLASGQTTPSWVSGSQISDDANNVRKWYNGKTGKYFDIASTQVVRGSKTIAQYKTCPANYSCPSASYAVFYNLQNEFQQAGSSTQIITAFSFHDSLAEGVGTQDTLDGYWTTTTGTTGISDGTLGQKDRRRISAHEFGHNAGLGHVCDGTLMWAGGSCPLYAQWMSTALNGSQASSLSTSSPFFSSGSTSTYTGLGMKSGTSPAIYGSDVVFQANTTNLFRKVIGGGAQDYALGMSGCSSPAIYGDIIVFQANTGNLFRKNISTGGVADLSLGMAGCTNPAIYGTNVAFQANTGNLFLKNLGGGASDLHLGMAGGTSPAIYSDKVVFQANTGNLFRKNLTTGGVADLGLGMAGGTSPAIYGDNVVFQANTGSLYLKVLGGGTYNLGLGMAAGTSPAIYNDRVVFQANTGHLYFRNISTGTTRDLGLGMAAGTSPAIYGDNIVFQANTGVLWRYNLSSNTGGIL